MRISRNRYLGLAAIVGATLFAPSVTGFSQDDFCRQDAQELRAELQKAGLRYAAWALNSNGNLVWLLENPEDQTWALVVELRNGSGCRINNGTNWEWLPSDGGRQ